MWTDLALIERVSGAETVLWNKRSKCRRIGCDGLIYFDGYPPGMGASFHVRLEAEWVGNVRYPPGGRR